MEFQGIVYRIVAKGKGEEKINLLDQKSQRDFPQNLRLYFSLYIGSIAKLAHVGKRAMQHLSPWSSIVLVLVRLC